MTALVLAASAGGAGAQRLGRNYWEDLHNGYRFKPPDDWVVIPPQATEREAGITCKMEGDGRIMTFDGQMFQLKPDLTVWRIEPPPEAEASIGEGQEGEGEHSSNDDPDAAPRGLEDVLIAAIGSIRGLDLEHPTVDETIKGRHRIEGRHRAWQFRNPYYGSVVDTYQFGLEDAEVFLVFRVAEKVSKSWLKVFRRVGKSFEVIERERVLELEEGGTYQDIVAYHEELVSRTPGWRVVPVPSERYLIKTSSDDDSFVDDVIERLELSRDLFERDFPPDHPLTEVSVVRICGSEEEFHSYGGTSKGVGGWFSPATEELVLFDYKNIDRNATYAVMSHEAFHQYCHFLFERSEAHRWFDEGHGDYYGGVRFSRRHATITPKMPAGFDRLGVIKGMVQRNEQVPLAVHLNYDHYHWQNQGPSNVSCYAQSWSIIYMLRQGMLGNVPHKLWKDEYAEIIPNYMNALHREFKKAYGEILAAREAVARAEGRELDREERKLDSDDLEDGELEKIWAIAMAESWGRIDLDEFEENWLTFVRREL